MSTLYLPLLMDTPGNTDRAPLPLLLLKVTPEQATRAALEPNKFEMEISRWLQMRVPLTLLRLGILVPRISVKVGVPTPDFAEKFTELVYQAPEWIINLYEVDASILSEASASKK